MPNNSPPASRYLAKWTCTIEGSPPRDVAVAHTTAWAKATMGTWDLGYLAGDVAVIVTEFSLSAWTHGSPPVVLTLLLQEHVLTIEVRDTGAGLAMFAEPGLLGACARGFPAAVDIAQRVGADGGAWGTRVWARLFLQRGTAGT